MKKHINQWADIHEWDVRGGEFTIAKAYFNACHECITYYNGNVSKYCDDIADKATLKRNTVRVYMATMMTLARKYKRYEMLEDMIISLGYATVTWSEIRAVSKSHGKKNKMQPTKKAPRKSAKVVKVVNYVAKQDMTNAEIDALIADLRSQKKVK